MKKLLISLVAVLFIFGTANALTVLDFEDVPEQYWYFGGGQNLDGFYPGLNFGTSVTVLENVVYGYNDTGYPPHSGHQVIFSADNATTRVDFDNPTSHVGFWFTNGSGTLYLEGYDAGGNLLANTSAGSNYGTNDFMGIDAAGIDYVLIHNSADLYTIDDFEYEETGCCCDIEMIPDDDPVIVEPGGRFGYVGTICNTCEEPIATDVWGGVKYQGNFYQQFSFPNIPLNPGECLEAHAWQRVLGYAPAGTYSYCAYCGERPDDKCDSTCFEFTVSGARSGDNDQWYLEGNPFGIVDLTGGVIAGGTQHSEPIQDIQNPQGEILWDITHGVYQGYYPGDKFSEMVSLLGAEGYTVVTTYQGVQNIPLDPYCVIIISVGSSWFSAYSTAEVDALVDFVNNGGGLMIMGENANCPCGNVNPVANAFGCTVGLSNISPSDTYISDLTGHEMFDGVDQIYMRAGGDMSVNSPSQTEAWTDAQEEVVSSASYGNGRVVVVGDMNFWDNTYYDNADNITWMYNTIEWLCEGGVPCCDVDMTPDDDPVIVDPGGRFGLTGDIGNPTADPITTDVWGGVIYLGNFIQQFAFNNIPLNPGQSLTAHTWQNVPGFAPSGTYTYMAYCGDRPDVKCDSAMFPFTVTGARLADGATEWAIEGAFFGEQLIPAEYGLSSNYPNPFNATTTISYDLPEAGDVSLEVYNLMGQKVAALVDDYKEAGQYTVSWDAADFASGIYLYRMTINDKVFTKKMNLLK